MPSPGYTSKRTAKGMDARRKAFQQFWKMKVHPKATPGGMRRRGVFVPVDPSRHPGRSHRGRRA